jgi:hypothetical protein
MQLDARIDTLTDSNAVALLTQFAKGQPHQIVPRQLDDQVARQLRAAANLQQDQTAATTSGDLARTALRLLASDPERRGEVQALLDHPASEKFAIVESALLVSSVLIALETHVRFERSTDGRWSVKIEKKPTNAALLKDLLKKLLSFQ